MIINRIKSYVYYVYYFIEMRVLLLQKWQLHEFVYDKDLSQFNWLLYNCEKCKKDFVSVLKLCKVNRPWRNR